MFTLFLCEITNYIRNVDVYSVSQLGSVCRVMGFCSWFYTKITSLHYSEPSWDTQWAQTSRMCFSTF